MLDNVTPPDKATLTPKPKVEPIPICTVMSDGSLRIEQISVDLLDLQRLLLSAVAFVTTLCLRRSNQADRLLAMIQQKFEGFDAETTTALREHFGQEPQAPA